MTDVHQKKETKKTSTMSPIVAGIAGAIAGGVAVGAAIAMSDKKNQKKVKDAFVDAKGKVTDYIDTIKTQPVIEKNTKKLENIVKEIKK